MKKIKVLRIIGECKTGGTETIALNYYKNFDHNKISMDFLFYGPSLDRFNDELEKNGDKVYNVAYYSKHLFKSIIQIRKIVKSNHYDVVHAQLNALNFFPLFAAWLGGAKVRLASNHSTANLKMEFKKSLLKYILRPTCGIMATHFAACSKYAGKWAFGSSIVNSNKFRVIPNAIDLDKFRYNEEIRKKVRNDEEWNGKFIIGHVGRFVEQKNHRFIIDLFEKIYIKNNNARLILIGEGDLEQEIKDIVKSKKLSDVVSFYGIRFDVNLLMQGMDLFLFPSIYEGLGNVITESQAASLMSLSSDAVPLEVKMTEFAQFLSLNDSIDIWVNKVIEISKGYDRRDTYKDLEINGYEIKSAANDLVNYYNNISHEVK